MGVEEHLSNTIDITEQFRAWLLSLAVVEAYVGEDVVDTIVDPNCKKPLIWYNRTGIQTSVCLDANPSGELMLPERTYFVFEVIDDVDKLALTRKVALEIQLQAERHKACRPFGVLAVQMINITDVDDNYTPYAPFRVNGAEWTALQYEVVNPLGTIDLGSPDIIA